MSVCFISAGANNAKRGARVRTMRKEKRQEIRIKCDVRE